MLYKWYRKRIGRFVFRKMNLGIGLSLLLVFILLGFLTFNSYYKLLEEREQDLLNLRTENMQDELTNIISQFKRETISLYPLVRETLGAYNYFLPINVPGQEDVVRTLSERNYFSGLQSSMLERNPRALSVIMYRVADRKIFTKSRNPSAVLNDNFDFASFFASLPNDYEYPYIGKLDHLYTNMDRSVIFFVNPVFEINNIRYDKVQGYFMVGVDPKTLINLFQSDEDADNRLLIKLNGNVLLDSRTLSSFADSVEEDVLFKTLTIDRYGLAITGMTSTASIQTKLSRITMVLTGGLLLTWLVCLLLIHFILKFVIHRLKLMTQHFKRVQTNPFTEPMEKVGDDEISDLMDRFNRMTLEIQEHINRVYIAEMQKRNAEYLALKMQINPHFLYNTLESLRMQAVINRQSEMADKLFYLGKLYRWILKTEAEGIPIEEELQYTRYYLDLLMMGKSKQIDLEVVTDLDLSERFMPKFSLQPIVENAILHGELEKVKEPVIRLYIRLEDDFQIIEISNNGSRLAEAEHYKLLEMLKTKHIFNREHLGLKNIHERIRAYYGELYGLFLLPTGPKEDFTIGMKLPKDEKRILWEETDYAEAVDR